MPRGRRRTCPRCGSTQVVPIVYGFPSRDSMEELLEARERGEVSLGGCLVSDDDPEWHCNHCKNEWKAVRTPRMRSEK